MANNSKKLPKISRRYDFEQLAKSGKRTHVNSWLLFNFRKNEFGHLRCGWTIPKYVGNAVVRNRIRRWCREFFNEKRRNAWDPMIDLNVVIRRREKVFFKQLSHKEFKDLLERGLYKLERNVQSLD